MTTLPSPRTIADVAPDLAAGRLSPVELLQDALRRIEALEPRLHAFITLRPDEAIDAARTALRQKDVSDVTIFYRRTREEMPAFAEETLGAVQEGITLEALVTPARILSLAGKLTGLECVRNRLGGIDASGRRTPVPIPGSEFTIDLDTLIVAISEQPDVDSISPVGEPALRITESGTLEVNRMTLGTSRPGVFAGGDVTTGPNTVIDAIAAGKRAATMIDRYLTGTELEQPEKHIMPSVYIPPITVSVEQLQAARAEPHRTPAHLRRGTFTEVEMALLEADARREASRCLRCDLEFTKPAVKPQALRPDKQWLKWEQLV